MERIVFSGVSKKFSLSTQRHLLSGHLRSWLGKRADANVLWALKNVSFTVRDGESLAVIGANGAGKSTLLNLATGLCEADAGEVRLQGRLAALLELGSGFHSELTGAENLRIYAALLGLSRARTNQVFASIVDFSELGHFMDRPIRTYSAGMVLRLAFSVAIHADPDILLIDEVFAVGDQNFQAKCFERMLRFREAGKTMICVTHSTDLLRKMCDKAIWLDHGQLRLAGNLDEVLEAYQRRVVLPPAQAAL